MQNLIVAKFVFYGVCVLCFLLIPHFMEVQ